LEERRRNELQMRKRDVGRRRVAKPSAEARGRMQGGLSIQYFWFAIVFSVFKFEY
jgi:hypothetical protein